MWDWEPTGHLMVHNYIIPGLSPTGDLCYLLPPVSLPMFPVCFSTAQLSNKKEILEQLQLGVRIKLLKNLNNSFILILINSLIKSDTLKHLFWL